MVIAESEAWAQREGALDPNVRSHIVTDAKRLVGMVAAALPAQVAAAPARELWADVMMDDATGRSKGCTRWHSTCARAPCRRASICHTPVTRSRRCT